ncbi:MAG: hypothetical protein WA081_24095 [Desulfosalsimonadaceae bacterium]
MGKKSLTKSTTKKKKTTGKKPSGQAADIAVESTPKAPEAKAAAPAPAATEKKKPAAKKPTIKTLLKKDFGTWAPAMLFSVSPDETSVGNYTAPPFIDDADPAQAKTIRALLSKQFDLSIVEAPEAPQKPAATPKKKTPAAKPATPEPAVSAEKPVEKKAEKKPLSIPELLNLKFESWQPEKLFMPVIDPAHQPMFSAPGFVDAENPEEAARIKALLTRQFDLSVVEFTETPTATEPAEKTEIPPEKPAPAAEIAEPAVIEPVKTEEPPQPAAAKQPEMPAPESEKPTIVVEAPKPVEEKAPEPAAAEPPKPVEAPKKEEKKEPEKPKAEIKKETPKAPVKPAPKPAEKTPEPPTPVEPQPVIKKPETLSGPIKMLIACVGCIFGLLILASAMNTRNYYLKPAVNAVEIWQGTFSPKGRHMIMSVPGGVIPEPVQTVYAKEQALVPAFDYFMKKADALTETKGQPDFEAIKTILYRAIRFAPTIRHQNDVKSRLHQIDCLLLIYKADADAGKGTVEGYQTAITELNRVKALGLEKPQKALVDEKLDKYNKAKALLLKEYAVPEKYAAPVKQHPAEPKPH